MTDPTIRRQREVERRQREREAQERERVAKLTEPRPQQQDLHSQRLAALESEWQMFKAAANGAIRQQQQQAAQRALDQTMAELSALIRPPQPPEPTVIYAVEEGTGRLGYSDFNPQLMLRPLGWWR
jgi:hypothetical protein